MPIAPTYLPTDMQADWDKLEAARVRAEVPEGQPFLLSPEAGVTEEQVNSLVAVGAASAEKTAEGLKVTVEYDKGSSVTEAGPSLDVAAKPSSFSYPEG